MQQTFVGCWYKIFVYRIIQLNAAVFIKFVAFPMWRLFKSVFIRVRRLFWNLFFVNYWQHLLYIVSKYYVILRFQCFPYFAEIEW